MKTNRFVETLLALAKKIDRKNWAIFGGLTFVFILAALLTGGGEKPDDPRTKKEPITGPGAEQLPKPQSIIAAVSTSITEEDLQNPDFDFVTRAEEFGYDSNGGIAQIFSEMHQQGEVFSLTPEQKIYLKKQMGENYREALEATILVTKSMEDRLIKENIWVDYRKQFSQLSPYFRAARLVKDQLREEIGEDYREQFSAYFKVLKHGKSLGLTPQQVNAVLPRFAKITKTLDMELLGANFVLGMAMIKRWKELGALQSETIARMDFSQFYEFYIFKNGGDESSRKIIEVIAEEFQKKYPWPPKK